jgi:hypothetical protein
MTQEILTQANQIVEEIQMLQKHKERIKDSIRISAPKIILNSSGSETYLKEPYFVLPFDTIVNLYLHKLDSQVQHLEKKLEEL